MTGPFDPENVDDAEPGDFEDDQGDRLDEWNEEQEHDPEAAFEAEWNAVL